MDYLKDGIGLRAMAQRDPLIEYQREGFDMFNAMLEGIKEETVGYLFNATVQPAQPAQPAQPGRGPRGGRGGRVPSCTARPSASSSNASPPTGSPGPAASRPPS
jgi:preprotein translocase subunit SecA